MKPKLTFLFLACALCVMAQGPIFTASSGTSCAASLDTVNKVVVVACGVTPNPLVTVLTFNPHVLEGLPSNALFFSWGGVAMLFSKALPTAPMSYQYGITGVSGQTIQAALGGTVAITF